MDSSTDEYFGTLGGSLMKDLLADLQVDDNDWSLEQLEKELASLDQEPSLVEQQPLLNLNAASLVVSHSQERSSSILSMLPPGTSTSPFLPPGMGSSDGTDAWSLSLQKFTSLSLQDEFLAADSARKQTRPPPGLAALAGAEDYDVKEKQVIGPPPGLGGGLVDSQPEVPKLPLPGETSTIESIVGLTSPSVPTNTSKPTGDIPMAATTFPANNGFMNAPNGIPPQGAVMPPPQMRGGMTVPLPPPPPGQFRPPQGTMPRLPMGLPMQMPMPMNIPPTMGTPVTAPLTGVVVGSAVATAGPAWQIPRPLPLPTLQQQPSLPTKAYCNPYPGAPPIPATALASSFMSGRDIAYVVHSILKPVLAEGTSENDYYIQYIKRRIGGPQADPMNPKRSKEAGHDMASRENKSKEWASEKSVLGHVTKSNVARPRALIATPQPSADQENKEQRQRANLWKARVYCDQAYQAYQNVIDIWRAAPSKNGIPPQVQIHLVKLMKCMGIVLDNEKKVYTVSTNALKLILKLEKGRTLICRVLEQALLPPNAVQELLPCLLDIIIALPMTSGSNNEMSNNTIVEEKTIGRLFQAITGIVPKLNINGTTLVKCLEVALSHGKSSTCSIVRMGCMHSLLQKGAQVVPQDSSEEVKGAWGNAERKFMSGLQGA
mmetsp:Transcript_33553/g.79109  ORF Transcript_33553/g.79109 Transcript_33553/m.79109 type:complete len:659 (+) Transcript_33553:274-2250(+)